MFVPSTSLRLCWALGSSAEGGGRDGHSCDTGLIVAGVDLEALRGVLNGFVIWDNALC